MHGRRQSAKSFPTPRTDARRALFTLNIVSLSGTGALNLKVEHRVGASATKRAQSKLRRVFQPFRVNGGQTWIDVAGFPDAQTLASSSSQPSSF